MIPKVLPGLWRKLYEVEDVDLYLELPEVADLRQAFLSMVQAEQLHKYHCFFIGGLDESSGRYADGIELVRALSRVSKVKILVSSRPITACSAAFGLCPSIRLQDLTAGDITTYNETTIGAHSYIEMLRGVDLDGTNKIIQGLPEKASGVFLRVVLACRSLLDGFDAYDDLTDLQRRTDELPPELENLFQHMLGKIEPRYQRQAAKMLRLNYRQQVMQESLEALQYDVSAISTLGLAVINKDDYNLEQVTSLDSLTSKERYVKCIMMEG